MTKCRYVAFRFLFILFIPGEWSGEDVQRVHWFPLAARGSLSNQRPVSFRDALALCALLVDASAECYATPHLHRGLGMECSWECRPHRDTQVKNSPLFRTQFLRRMYSSLSGIRDELIYKPRQAFLWWLSISYRTRQQ